MEGLHRPRVPGFAQHFGGIAPQIHVLSLQQSQKRFHGGPPIFPRVSRAPCWTS